MADLDIYDCTILIVDDDERFCRTIYRFLEAEGHRSILVAQTIAEARYLLDSTGSAIHLVVIDVNLPDGSGADLIRQIEDLRQATIGVFFVTAWPQLVETDELNTAGVWIAGTLEKPMEKDVVAQSVGDALRTVIEKRGTVA